MPSGVRLARQMTAPETVIVGSPAAAALVQHRAAEIERMPRPVLGLEGSGVDGSRVADGRDRAHAGCPGESRRGRHALTLRSRPPTPTRPAAGASVPHMCLDPASAPSIDGERMTGVARNAGTCWKPATRCRERRRYDGRRADPGECSSPRHLLLRSRPGGRACGEAGQAGRGAELVDRRRGC